MRVNKIVVFKSTQKGLPTPDSDAIYAQGSSPFLLDYEKHPNYLGRAFENTCAEIKNKNLVCAKNQEIHADNSKTRIRYVQKSRKYMRIIQKS